MPEPRQLPCNFVVFKDEAAEDAIEKEKQRVAAIPGVSGVELSYDRTYWVYIDDEPTDERMEAIVEEIGFEPPDGSPISYPGIYLGLRRA